MLRRPSTSLSAQAPGTATQFDSLLAAEQLQHLHEAAGGAVGADTTAGDANSTDASGEAPPATAQAGEPQAAMGSGGATPALPAAVPDTQQQQAQRRQQPGHPAAGGSGPLCSWVSPTQQERTRRRAALAA